MLVKDLIARLKTYDPNDVVLIHNGGHLRNIIEIDDATCVLDTDEIYLKELTLGHLAAGFTIKDLYDGADGQPSVVLYPI